MRRWQTFSLFALSELVCTKNVFYPILLFPLLSHPKLLPLWSVPDGQRNLNTPCYLSSFFFHWARGALPAGATLLGWPNYGVDGRLNKEVGLGSESPTKDRRVRFAVDMPTAEPTKFTLSLLINNLWLLSYAWAHHADSMAEASINMLHQHY